VIHISDIYTHTTVADTRLCECSEIIQVCISFTCTQSDDNLEHVAAVQDAKEVLLCIPRRGSYARPRSVCRYHERRPEHAAQEVRRRRFKRQLCSSLISEIFEVNEISVPTKEGAEVAAYPLVAAIFSTYGDAVHVLELLGLQAALAVPVPPYRHGRTKNIFLLKFCI
jgi:hypothetical protein